VVKKKERVEVVIDPVSLLANDYAKDLDELRKLDPAIITEIDMKRLKKLALKYGLNPKIDKQNFPTMVGKLSKHIQDLLGDLAYDILERERELKPEKKPKKKKIRKEEISPEELWEG
jgi:hypothetical protein